MLQRTKDSKTPVTGSRAHELEPINKRTFRLAKK